MDKDAEIKQLKMQLKQLLNGYVSQGAILEAIEIILDGSEPSDFMLSFPVVRKVFDAMCAKKDCGPGPW